LWNGNATYHSLSAACPRQPATASCDTHGTSTTLSSFSHVMEPSCPQMQIIARHQITNQFISGNLKLAPAKSNSARYWVLSAPQPLLLRRVRRIGPRNPAGESYRNRDVTSAPYISRLKSPVTAASHPRLGQKIGIVTRPQPGDD
jgi:hypothetical protein